MHAWLNLTFLLLPPAVGRACPRLTGSCCSQNVRSFLAPTCSLTLRHSAYPHTSEPPIKTYCCPPPGFLCFSPLVTQYHQSRNLTHTAGKLTSVSALWPENPRMLTDVGNESVMSRVLSPALRLTKAQFPSNLRSSSVSDVLFSETQH